MSQDQPQDSSALAPSSPWKVDFKWGKQRFLITDTSSIQDVAIIRCKLREPSLEFRTPDDKTTFGTGTVHAISIHPDYECNGFKGPLRASSRWATRYQPFFPNFGTPANPMVMSWTTSSSSKDWDFICLDDKGEAVARYATKIWATKKVGVIEFVGPKAEDLEARREILVTGVLMWYTMLVRVNNPLNLMYSIFGKAGPIRKDGGRGIVGDGGAEVGRDDEAAGSNR
ncbi:hypothetical protein CLAFUW4_05859 [Fulvia fulva]|uniref:Uncharacterized protein n=1 Tax=Passalora fulva TaxID=5499 RepID=A0A9Q8P9J4_PASFU|nr:uncharacterized protein CLAFUR5_06002 [Fulvia fulva]KAK4624272.1 hypothetical protein CLAFUR4_05853 [Fulvia fulva]KAK4625072.1 hypothetical protein CLAFUR0_05865 [Fulvia fulva]UJO18122.1 hypothetical protein CLAFUR5_06002 [Fulvia fulva]WPV15503.1 hypothetical protein CLAFUW4_05859 [Fulvia fulva]WPV29764.1 hypothetical protein CLAFUW7_05857 [Fulvia fulva]